MPVYPLSVNGMIMLSDGRGGQITLQSLITFYYQSALRRFFTSFRNGARLQRDRTRWHPIISA